MTTVEIDFRFEQEPSELALRALANVRQVYGIRALAMDCDARRVRVEFDTTRMNAATVASLLRRAGLDLAPSAQEVALPTA